MGTHLRVLAESYPMNANMTGFRWASNSQCCGPDDGERKSV